MKLDKLLLAPPLTTKQKIEINKKLSKKTIFLIGICFFQLLNTSNIWSQCDDPITIDSECLGTGDVNDYKIIQVATAIDVGTLVDQGCLLDFNSDLVNSPQRIIVVGEIHFDQSYTFGTGSEIIFMNLSSSFLATSGAVLSIFGTSIHGCEQNWGEIGASDATLDIRHSEIRDAVAAIRLYNNAHISLYDNDFRGNVFSIFASPLGGTGVVNVTPYAKGILGNRFYGDDPLIGGNLNMGQPFGTVNYPLCAVLLQNVLDFRMGRSPHPLSGSAGRNIIQDYTHWGLQSYLALPSGIISSNSNMTIRGTTFSNIGVLNYPSNDILCHGIFATSTPGSTSTLDFEGIGQYGDPTFEDVYFAFNCTNMNVYVQKANIQGGYKQMFIHDYSNPCLFDIKNNYFHEYLRSSIFASNAFPSLAFRVRGENVFEDDSAEDLPGFPRETIGAVSQFTANSNLFIDNNQIVNKPKNISQSHIGLYLGNLTLGNITANEIDNEASNIFTGIDLTSCDGMNIMANSISGNTSFSTNTLSSSAVRLNASGNNLIKCNSTNYTKSGISFDGGGACDGTDIRANSLLTHTTGLHISQGTYIGQQTDKQNQWPGSASTTEARLDLPLITDPLYPFYLNNNIFYIDFDENSYPEYWANPRTPSGSVWFRSSQNQTEYPTANCYTVYPPDRDPNLTEADRAILANTFPSAEYEAFAWDASFRLFDRLHRNEDLRPQSSLVEAYYDSCYHTNLGRLYRVYASLQTIGLPEEPERTNLEESYNRIRELMLQIDQVDSLLGETTYPDTVQYYTSQQDSLAQLLISADTTNKSLLQTLQTAKLATVQSLLSELDSISTTSLAESNMHIVLRVLLECISEDNQFQYSTQQQDDLESVAYQCILEGGKAVHLARLALKMQPGDYEESDYCEEEEERGLFTQSIDNNSALFSVSPNPAADAFTIRRNNTDEPATFFLNNLYGRVVKEVDLSNRQNSTIHVLDLAPGVYIGQLITEGKHSSALKIVVHH